MENLQRGQDLLLPEPRNNEQKEDGGKASHRQRPESLATGHTTDEDEKAAKTTPSQQSQSDALYDLTNTQLLIPVLITNPHIFAARIAADTNTRRIDNGEKLFF